MSDASTIGLARLPGEVRDLLDEAADNAAAAATVFEHLLETRDRASFEELEVLEVEGDRITHELTRALRGGRVSSDERGRLLNLAQTVDDSIDALQDAGYDALSCDCGDDAVMLASVIRDVIRVEARALHALAHADRADLTLRDLEREGKRIARHAVADALRPTDDPLAAIRRRACLQRLERSFAASLRAVRATGQTTVTAG